MCKSLGKLTFPTKFLWLHAITIAWLSSAISSNICTILIAFVHTHADNTFFIPISHKGDIFRMLEFGL